MIIWFLDYLLCPLCPFRLDGYPSQYAPTCLSLDQLVIAGKKSDPGCSKQGSAEYKYKKVQKKYKYKKLSSQIPWPGVQKVLEKVEIYFMKC